MPLKVQMVDWSKKTPRFFQNCLTLAGEGPIDCCSLSEMLSGAMMGGSALSGLSWRKFSDIQSFTAVKQPCKGERLQWSSDLKE